mgnify:FL=1
MIGIITLYYKNYNIGGLLQAYALQKILSNLNIESEQVRVWHYKREYITFQNKVSRKIGHIIKNPIKEAKVTINNSNLKKRRKLIQDELLIRENLMEQFMDRIPHSNEVYDIYNISESLQLYNGYIVGSDQIWNDDYITQDYMKINMLSFVPNTILKMSYAASIGKHNNFKDWFINDLDYLKKFDAISVREKTANAFLKNRKIESIVTLDPTLLLEKDEWNKFVNKEKLECKSQYVFTYFLGKDKENRIIAEKIAQRKNLSIVNFAHAINYFRDEDKYYGDYKIIEYSPDDFINYIANAKIVITDSFHAAVFSIIFNKEFWIVPRLDDSGISSMNSRLNDLLEAYGIQERYINTREDAENKNLYKKINYDDVNKHLNEQRKDSIEFIVNSIHKQKN